MKLFFALFMILLTAAAPGWAAEETAEMVQAAVVTEAAPLVSPAPAATPETPPVPATVPAEIAPLEAVQEPSPSENLEFVSGEITALDEASKTITIKLYGETEEGGGDKILSIKLDENTDITDGEKDRDLKSLTAGTEVDVEYDPGSKKATYLFVY